MFPPITALFCHQAPPALVVSAEGELSFYLSDNTPDAPVPRLVQLLVAVLMRSEDDD